MDDIHASSISARPATKLLIVYWLSGPVRKFSIPLYRDFQTLRVYRWVGSYLWVVG